MKKNTKIGVGVAVAAVVSLAVALPILADIEPEDIETTGTTVTEEADETELSIREVQADETEFSLREIQDEEALTEETEVEETQAEETQVEETQIEETQAEETQIEEEDTSTIPDFANSPNFCKLDFSNDGDGFENVVPSDYEDPELRRLAEEYVAKGYLIDDCKYCATHYGSGMGDEYEYVFCNGFTVTDNREGNNTLCHWILKATPAEFEWYMNLRGYEVTYDGDQVYIEDNSDYMLMSFSYDRGTEIFTHKVQFLTTDVLG